VTVRTEYTYITGVPADNETQLFNASYSLWLCWDFNGDEEFDSYSQANSCCFGMSKTYWTWGKSGNYNIRVKTKKEINGEYVYSDWSEPLSVSVKSRIMRTYPALMQLLDLFSSKLILLKQIFNP